MKINKTIILFYNNFFDKNKKGEEKRFTAENIYDIKTKE